MTDDNKTLIEELEEDPRVRTELAAARLASTVGALMEQVGEATSAKYKDVAAAMGVTAGRVSQILSGDGNVRIATLARFLDACGYELELTARPKSGRGPTITLPRPPRRRRSERSDASGTAARWTPSTTKVSTVTKVGFRFVTHEGVSVLRDSAHDIFPAEVGAPRVTKTETSWETVS
jgi:transcriptional regulator with XRE-family HTH domain